MIAVVGLTPEVRCGWVAELDSLPRAPALAYSGFLIGCLPPPDTIIEWYLEMRRTRPHVPIGAVVAPGDPFVFEVARSGVHFEPLLAYDEMPNGRVPIAILEQLRDSAVEGRILDPWAKESKSRSTGHEDGDDAVLKAATAAVGAAGGRVSTLCKRLNCKRTTLYRRFERAGLEEPARLLTRARIESVQIRIELGMNAAIAREAAGWSTPQAYRKARSRQRGGTNRGGS
jgi:AraC-like DNA-binding protein